MARGRLRAVGHCQDDLPVGDALQLNFDYAVGTAPSRARRWCSLEQTKCSNRKYLVARAVTSVKDPRVVGLGYSHTATAQKCVSSDGLWPGDSWAHYALAKTCRRRFSALLWYAGGAELRLRRLCGGEQRLAGRNK